MIRKSKSKFLAIASVLLSISSASYAVNSGVYLGIQFGQTNIHNKKQSITLDSAGDTEVISPKNTGFGGRISFGYNFNQYAAWELGLTKYSSSTYKVPNTSGGNPGIHETSVELLAKGIYPFGKSGFGIFGKAGIAAIYAGTSASIHLESGSNKKSFTSAHPAIGFGVSYDINQSWVADLSYNSVLGSGTIQRADFIALGISYHWVDLYCGQFLC